MEEDKRTSSQTSKQRWRLFCYVIYGSGLEPDQGPNCIVCSCYSTLLCNAGVGADVSSHSVSLQKVIPYLLLLLLFPFFYVFPSFHTCLESHLSALPSLLLLTCSTIINFYELTYMYITCANNNSITILALYIANIFLWYIHVGTVYMYTYTHLIYSQKQSLQFPLAKEYKLKVQSVYV